MLVGVQWLVKRSVVPRTPRQKRSRGAWHWRIHRQLLNMSWTTFAYALPFTGILAATIVSLLGREAISASRCSMRTINAKRVALASVHQMLAESSEPILVRNAMAQWAGTSLAQLEAHSTVRVDVVRSASTEGSHVAPTVSALSFGEYVRAVRSVSVPRGEYCFTDISSTLIAAEMPELCDLFAKVVCGCVQRVWPPKLCLTHPAVRGTLRLFYGGEGSGYGLHQHGPSLHALLDGEMRWIVQRPNTTMGEPEMDELITRAGHGWSAMRQHAWQRRAWLCTQSAGDLIWVPASLAHRTASRGAVATLTTRLEDSSLAHEVAHRGGIAEVQRLFGASALPSQGERRP